MSLPACSQCNKCMDVSSSNQATGICLRCRERMKYGACRGCCNYTIPPGGKKEDCKVCAGAKPVAHITLQPKDPDLSDWRTWRDFGKPTDQCPCGIPKDTCEYHR